jgi:hypothetical protein
VPDRSSDMYSCSLVAAILDQYWSNIRPILTNFSLLLGFVRTIIESSIAMNDYDQ